MSATAVEPQTDRSPSAARTSSRGKSPFSAVVWWPLAAVLVTIFVASARLLVTPEFYFADDTQTGTAGQWWRIGELLLTGQLPFFDPHTWTAGNYLAEGQWGVFNPLIWVIGIVTRLAGDVFVTVTVVKIAMLGVMALGVYLLARSFSADAPWAAAAGVLAPLGGFTVYMDAASWTTGLFASAVLPWAWWGLRRLVEEKRNPFPFLIAAGILITFGYVFGVIVLVFLLGESLIRAILHRDRWRIASTLVAGIYSALLTVTVYLPSVLTAPVTVRGTTSIANGGFLNADLADLAATSSALATGSIGSWAGGVTESPLMYALWAVPAFALFRPSRALMARLIPALVVGGLVLLLVTGPDQIGPIRWPVRFMPYVVIAVVVVFAAIASEARPLRSPRRALVTALAIIAGSGWFSAVSTTWEWRQIALSMLCQAVGVVVLWGLFYRGVIAWPRAQAAAAVVAAGVGVLLVVPQMALFPSTILPKLPVVDAAESASILDGMPDDVIVVGDIYASWEDAASYEERLVANQWYFSDSTVSSTYTVLPFRDYVRDLCADLRGSTCSDALGTLLSTDTATGQEVSALLGVNTIVVIKASFPDGVPEPPAGWSMADDGVYTRVLTRDAPVATAGGVAWESAGTTVEVLEQSDSRLELRVGSIGDDSQIVLSRLAWPGYTVSGATFAAETRGYLATLDLSEAQTGDVIVVQFQPPGWWVEMVSLLLALIVLAGWPVANRRLRTWLDRRSTASIAATA
ncbi:MAG: hypothetical protein Q7T17_00230 [Microbacterium sp.]|uniref:hypothetical protein n=1 Tax=Microbacterium sp. TaxID=51671 RepID=UPI002719046D|nr:hypothetical protein [Microbacterium sp.]MDO8381398.1 hypothetical protein [Microbacterium sp.]